MTSWNNSFVNYIKKLQKLINLAPVKSVEPPPPKKVKTEAIIIVDDEVEDEQTSTSSNMSPVTEVSGLFTYGDR